MAAAGGSLLHGVAEALGASEAALRLILSIFIGYPLALFQRYFLFKKEPSHNHLFNTLTGLCIAYFNFGSQMYHSVLCVVLHFLMLRLMGRTITAVLTSFCFQMTYLLCGYYYTATDNYDIKWTMPHCVLTLKLIGLAFDYYDGGKDKLESQISKTQVTELKSSLTPEQQRHIVPRAPTLLEVCGFSYYYGGFLVGPQFSMCSYLKLVNGELTDVEGQRPNSIRPAMERLCLGLCTLTIYTVFGPYLPDSYFLSEEYANQPFWYRCVYMTIWGKVMLYKYVTCWLVTEGVCILCGLGYNGKDEQGRHHWNACANMKVWLFETTPLFTGTIASFNINTNDWVARYVFKRLRFLGNKAISQGSALFFLAIWHGLHSGYLVCFALEFLIVIVERKAMDLVRDSPLLTSICSNPVLYPFLYIAQQIFHWLFMGYPLVPFCLFTWDKWLKVYTSVYFIGHVTFILLLIVLPYLRTVLVQKKDKLQKSH